eukprot:gene8730-9620_t
MGLESTMICLDNSDWMRNGDYVPTRIDAQQDAACMLCNDRMNSNPENTVGLLSMAGKGVDLLVSPTEESGKVLAAFGQVKLGGKTDFITAIQIAQLALKHRKNKNGAQRIVVFVGSPLRESPEALTRLGKQLKKNNVAVDIISMGEVEDNTAKLQDLVNAVNSNDNSHLVTVPGGVSPANVLLSSPVMFGSTGIASMGAAPMGGGDNFDLYGGIDPSLDPELAMAIRVSTEEARAAEEARLKAAQQETSAQPSSEMVTEDDSEEALMQRALEMSMREAAEAAAASATTNQETVEKTEEIDEDEELARALAMSVESQQEAAQSATSFNDPEFVQQLLSNPDLNDPIMQAALAQLQANQKKQGEDKEDEDEGGKSRKRKNDS